jgi:hypothetical protein
MHLLWWFRPQLSSVFYILFFSIYFCMHINTSRRTWSNLPTNGLSHGVHGCNRKVQGHGVLSDARETLTRCNGYRRMCTWPSRLPGGVHEHTDDVRQHIVRLAMWFGPELAHSAVRCILGSAGDLSVKWWCAHSHLINSLWRIREFWLPAMTRTAYVITLWPGWATEQVLHYTRTLRILYNFI